MGAARTGKPGDCRNQMQKKDGKIAHRAILARSRHAQEMPTNWEFAMHTLHAHGFIDRELGKARSIKLRLTRAQLPDLD